MSRSSLFPTDLPSKRSLTPLSTQVCLTKVPKNPKRMVNSLTSIDYTNIPANPKPQKTSKQANIPNHQISKIPVKFGPKSKAKFSNPKRLQKKIIDCSLQESFASEDDSSQSEENSQKMTLLAKLKLGENQKVNAKQLKEAI